MQSHSGTPRGQTHLNFLLFSHQVGRREARGGPAAPHDGLRTTRRSSVRSPPVAGTRRATSPRPVLSRLDTERTSRQRNQMRPPWGRPYSTSVTDGVSEGNGKYRVTILDPPQDRLECGAYASAIRLRTPRRPAVRVCQEGWRPGRPSCLCRGCCRRRESFPPAVKP